MATEIRVHLIDRRDAYYQMASREIDLLNERTNLFLLYNSILMAGLALGKLSDSLMIVVAIAGLLSSFIWLYLGQRGIVLEKFAWKKVYSLEEQQPRDERIHTQFKKYRQDTRPSFFGWRSSVYVGRVIPILWALTWAVVLAIAQLA